MTEEGLRRFIKLCVKPGSDGSKPIIHNPKQFPKFINVSCDYRYIGRHLPSKYGIHFGYDESKPASAFYKSDLDNIDADPTKFDDSTAAAGKSGRLG